MIYSEWLCTVSDDVTVSDGVQWVMGVTLSDGVQWVIVTVSDDVQWVMVYSEWLCTQSDGVQWVMVYNGWCCTVSDDAQWVMMYSEWWCTVSDGGSGNSGCNSYGKSDGNSDVKLSYCLYTLLLANPII